MAAPSNGTVGPNRPLRDIRNTISKEYNAWIDEYVPLSEGFRGGTIPAADAKAKFDDLKTRIYALSGKFNDLREQAGKADPFDPTLIKDLDSTSDSIYNNSKSIEYDLKLIRKLDDASSKSTSTQTAGDTVEAKQGNAADAGKVSSDEQNRIKQADQTGSGEDPNSYQDERGTYLKNTPNGEDSAANSANATSNNNYQNQSPYGSEDQIYRWGSNTQVLAGPGDPIKDPGAISVSQDQGIKFLVTPNPLHNYASYTYSLSMHILSAADFNKMAADPLSSNWKPSATLIGGAGKYSDDPESGFVRDSNFQDDFYFESLKMTTVIGSSQGNQGTNSIELSFTILEPYGITLLDRLIDACLDPKVQGQNYLEVPYLLQIDFYGYDDDGISRQLTSQRKYLPIKLNSMGIKASTKGAEYQITATPYVHKGFTESVAATPANFEVTAGTLEEFFKSDTTTDDTNAVNQEYQRQESEKQKADTEAKNQEKGSTPRTQDKANSSNDANSTKSDPSIDVRSYVAAYNAWQRKTVENKAATSCNQIEVVFDNTIKLQQAIVFEKEESIKKVATSNVKNKKHRADVERANAGVNTARPNFGQTKRSVAQGDNIISVINAAMMGSAYVRNQIIDATLNVEQNAEKYNKDVQWWKVIPSVKLTSFDKVKNVWAMKITYNVVSYTKYNRSHPNIGKSLPTSWCKEYNYIYTGQNDDIIDFSLDFDTTFYTAVMVDRAAKTATQQTASVEIAEYNTMDIDTQKRIAISGLIGQSAVTPVRTEPVAAQMASTATGDATKSAAQGAASSVADHLQKNQGADMLAVKLKIVGDPQFIKQDEIFVSPAARLGRGGPDGQQPSEKSSTIQGDEGSIVMDDSEIHVKLSWKTPVDIDEFTGGLRDDDRYKLSAFSGLYNVIMVESVFQNGKFEQTLEMTRLQDQPVDGKVQDTAKLSFDPVVPAPSIEETNASILSAITKNNSPNTGDSNSSTPTPEQRDDEQTNEKRDNQAEGLKQVVNTAPTEQIGAPGAGTGTNPGPAPKQESVYQSTYNNAIANGIPPMAAASQASAAARSAGTFG